MWSLLVVGSDVGLEHSLEVPTTVDQDVVKALFAHGPHKALREGIRPGGPDRGSDDPTASFCLPNRASGAFLHRVSAGTIRSRLDGQVTGSADRGVAALPPLSPARRSWRIVR